MPKLFWRIFFSFWITITILMGGLSDHLARQNDIHPRLEMARENIEQRSQQLADQIPNLNRKQIIKLLKQQKRRSLRQIYIFDESNIELLGREFKIEQKHKLNKHKKLPTIITQDSNGKEYRIIGNPFFKRHVLTSRGTRGTIARIVIATLLSAIVSYLLARSLSSPLTRLRKTSQALAGGDFSARAGHDLSLRKDEIGQLAADFDDMAAKLQKLDQSRIRLLADVSHELRSPLARLQVALELARNKRSENVETELDRIELESHRLEELIGQVLTLLRHTTSNLPVQKHRQDINALLRQLISHIDYHSPVNDQPAIKFANQETIYCDVDLELFRRAIENIISNALRYTSMEKGVHVSTARSNHNVVIKITDFGTGVSEERLVHLFDAFYRVSEARDRDSGGYGLGLAIAAAAIESHGGSIKAENHLNGGLEIIITLPCSGS